MAGEGAAGMGVSGGKSMTSTMNGAESQTAVRADTAAPHVREHNVREQSVRGQAVREPAVREPASAPAVGQPPAAGGRAGRGATTPRWR